MRQTPVLATSPSESTDWLAYSEYDGNTWTLPLRPEPLPCDAEDLGDGFAREFVSGQIVRYWISRENAEREGLLSGLGAVEEEQ